MRYMTYLYTSAARGWLRGGGRDVQMGRAQVESVRDACTVIGHVRDGIARPVVELAAPTHVTGEEPVVWIAHSGGIEAHRKVRAALQTSNLYGDRVAPDSVLADENARRELQAEAFKECWDSTAYWETFRVLARDSDLTMEKLLAATRTLVPVTHQERTVREVAWPYPIAAEIHLSPRCRDEDTLDVLWIEETIAAEGYMQILSALARAGASRYERYGKQSPEFAGIVHRPGADLPPF